MTKYATRLVYSYCFILSIITLIGVKQYALAVDIPAMPIRIVQAEKKDVAVTIAGSGHIVSLAVINIKSRIDGKLNKVLIEDGAIVKEGDQLFEIDTVPFELAVNQAEADLNKAIASSTESKEMAGIARKLYSKEVIAKEKMDQKIASEKETLASVNAAQAALQTAKQNLDYCKIRAPISGMLGRKLINKGNLITSYTDVLIILNDIENLKVIFSLPAKELRRIKKYQSKAPLKIKVTSSTDENVSLEGTLNYLGNQIDYNSGMFEVQGVLKNKDFLLWPGEFVTAVITLTTRPDSIVIPARALINSTDDSKMVYVIDKDIAQPRPVKVGWVVGNQAIILEGLKAEEQVAIEGLFKLYPGAKVKIISAKEQK